MNSTSLPMGVFYPAGVRTLALCPVLPPVGPLQRRISQQRWVETVVVVTYMYTVEPLK